MTASHRLTLGGRLDRSRAVRFTFDGKSYHGFAGDTLASAMIANGVHLVGRSFKYHRPRGIMTAGSDEPNALVGVGADETRYTPNLRATQVELHDGLVAESPESLAIGLPLMSARPTRPSLRSCRPASTTRPSCGRRRHGKNSTNRSFAARPVLAARRNSPTRIATLRSTRIATYWWSAPVPQVSRRRWRRQGRAPKSFFVTSNPKWAARC